MRTRTTPSPRVYGLTVSRAALLEKRAGTSTIGRWPEAARACDWVTVPTVSNAAGDGV